MKKYNKEILDKIFNLFVGNDELRPVMHKPINVQDKFISATDAHTLIIVDKDLCDYETNNPYEENINVLGVIPFETQDLKIDIEKIDFDAYKTADEYKVTEEEVECKACEGSGEVEVEFYHKRNYYIDVDCPVCDGTGIEEEEKKELTGNKTFPEKCFVRIDKAVFRIEFFDRILSVKKILQENDISLISESLPNGAHCFKVGDFKILLMPYSLVSMVYDEIIIDLL